MKRVFTIRLLHKGENTTLRISSDALDAMLDMARRMLCEGRIDAFSVENHGHSITSDRKRGE